MHSCPNCGCACDCDGFDELVCEHHCDAADLDEFDEDDVADDEPDDNEAWDD